MHNTLTFIFQEIIIDLYKKEHVQSDVSVGKNDLQNLYCDNICICD